MRVRRSPHLVGYWQGGALHFYNYATRRSAKSTPFVCSILDTCHEWRTLPQIAARIGVTPSAGFDELIARLVSLTLLEESGRGRDARNAALDVLASWNPEAGFFHMATRDVPFASPKRVARQERLRELHGAAPRPVKRYPGAEMVPLRPPPDEPFVRILNARRTWRRYSSSPVMLDELATLLGVTAGVQRWALVSTGALPLKTSPSGGARHGIECYVVVRAVRGIRPGVYHYASDAHRLERLRGRVSDARLRRYVPNSGYFARASAMVFFTAVFERILWRYPYSRAYRAALIEAGHVCQTFLLTATWLGLAPYCVLGLADSLIEEDLGIDGITESVLYCAGVGRPPRGSTWAPLTRGRLATRPNPALTP
ncbi:MAG TPA: SagB/ThcOx family dehydrogenase [Vicinamibacterales bacterium]|nr:SagB/ThcOx family dehydrogenase [Vicinamibacterales bacterium]